MLENQNCEARRYNDEMQCGKCGLTWDINDSDRPHCKSTKVVKPLSNKQHVMNLRNKIACNTK